MKIMFYIMMFTAFIYAQQREVLVEVFTNSHCPNCPAAHNTFNSYDNNSTNAQYINYIYIHHRYPYADDPLYQANMTDPDARNSYYGTFTSAPLSFIDGVRQDNSYNQYASRLDVRSALASPLTISLTGSTDKVNGGISAEVTQTGNIDQSDLVIHFVIVENVDYGGRNGVKPQHFVLRKMITTASGEAFSISQGETKSVSKSFTVDPSWIADSLNFIVFVQSTGTKEIYQSARIPFTELSGPNGIEAGDILPADFRLEQNYPNPFNPSTTVSFVVGKLSFVTLKIYDVLGNEVAALVNEEKAPGQYDVTFNAENFSSGVYYYMLSAGSYKESRKMILMK